MARASDPVSLGKVTHRKLGISATLNRLGRQGSRVSGGVHMALSLITKSNNTRRFSGRQGQNML